MGTSFKFNGDSLEVWIHEWVVMPLVEQLKGGDFREGVIAIDIPKPFLNRESDIHYILSNMEFMQRKHNLTHNYPITGTLESSIRDNKLTVFLVPDRLDDIDRVDLPQDMEQPTTPPPPTELCASKVDEAIREYHLLLTDIENAFKEHNLIGDKLYLELLDILKILFRFSLIRVIDDDEAVTLYKYLDRLEYANVDLAKYVIERTNEMVKQKT